MSSHSICFHTRTCTHTYTQQHDLLPSGRPHKPRDRAGRSLPERLVCPGHHQLPQHPGLHRQRVHVGGATAVSLASKALPRSSWRSQELVPTFRCTVPMRPLDGSTKPWIPPSLTEWPRPRPTAEACSWPPPPRRPSSPWQPCLW